MENDLLRPDLVQFDWEVADQGELFEKMTEKLVAAGYVRDTFGAAIAAREAKYPTALPTQPEAVAIPHGDAEHIITPFIAPMRLATPVQWHEMGNDENVHPVRFVFMLGLNKAEGQLAALQGLVQSFQDPQFYTDLDSASTPEEFYDVVKSIDGFSN